MHFRTDGWSSMRTLRLTQGYGAITSDQSSCRAGSDQAAKMTEGHYSEPTTPIGRMTRSPRDGRIFVDFLNGKFPAYMDTG